MSLPKRWITQLAGLLAASCALLATLGALASPASAATAPTISKVLIVTDAPTTATVAATVDLNGTAPATSSPLANNCQFNYGTAAPASGSSPTGGPGSPDACVSQLTTAEDNQSVVVAQNLTGLAPATTYYINLSVATGGLLGALSTANPGPVITFTTPSATVPPTVTGLTATTPTSTTATLTASVNAQNWPITSCKIEYGTSAASLTTTAACPTMPTGSTATPESLNVTGLTPATTYSYNVVLGYDTDGTSKTATTVSGTTNSFTTPTAGTASTGQATAVTTTGATLNATVDPQGQTVVSCTFLYVTGTSAAVAKPCDQSIASLSSQNTNVPVTAELTGLATGTTYSFDIVLVTSTGSSLGALGTFTTLKPPTGTTHGPTSVTSTTATLNATINAEGSGIIGCAFQYGVAPLPAGSVTGTNAGLAVACTKTPSDTGDQPVSIVLKGLAPKTTYYYRVIVATAAGNVIGTTVKFETAAAAKKVTAPGMKITKATVDTKRLQASFHFAHTGDAATSSQCGLATDTKGKIAKFSYKTCKSGVLYKKLKRKTTYVFYVRGHNSAGYGKAASKKFTA